MPLTNPCDLKWFWPWIAFQSGLFFLAVLDPAWSPLPEPCSPHHWSWPAATLLAVLAGLPFYGSWVHRHDSGWGFRGFRRLQDARFDTSREGLSALLARQAIYAAIPLALLVFVSDKWLTGTEPRFELHYGIRAILLDPAQILLWLMLTALSASVLAVLVSALCYDAVMRWVWPEDDAVGDFRRAFVRKGALLEALAWYCLLWGLLAIVGLIHPVLGHLAAAGVFCAHWYYYRI